MPERKYRDDEIPEYLQEELGWRERDDRGVIDRRGNYRVDLNSEDGHAWSLQRFDGDSMPNARWRNIDVQGETLEELRDALGRLGLRTSRL